MVSTRYIALSGGLLQTCHAHISTFSPRLLRAYGESESRALQSRENGGYGVNGNYDPYGSNERYDPYRLNGQYDPRYVSNGGNDPRYVSNGGNDPRYVSNEGYDQRQAFYPNGRPLDNLYPPTYRTSPYPPSGGTNNMGYGNPTQNTWYPTQNNWYPTRPNSGSQIAPGDETRRLVADIKEGRVRVQGTSLNWLIAEWWLSPENDMWRETSDQERYNERSFMNAPSKGKSRQELIEEFRRTWYTKNDLMKIKYVGFNLVQVSVAYWIVPSLKGPEDSALTSAIEYLDILIKEWAVELQLAVIVTLKAHKSCHNLEASTNCIQNKVVWGSPQSIDESTEFATTIARRYKDEAAFLGMELIPNPAAPITQEQLQMYYSAVDRALTSERIDCVLVIAGLDANDLMVWKDFTQPRPTMWLGYASFLYWGFEGQNNDDILKEIEKRKEKLKSYTSAGLKTFITGWSAAAPESAKMDSPVAYRQLIGAQMLAYRNAKQGSVMVCWKVLANKYTVKAFDTESMIDFGALGAKKATPFDY